MELQIKICSTAPFNVCVWRDQSIYIICIWWTILKYENDVPWNHACNLSPIIVRIKATFQFVVLLCYYCEGVHSWSTKEVEHTGKCHFRSLAKREKAEETWWSICAQMSSWFTRNRYHHSKNLRKKPFVAWGNQASQCEGRGRGFNQSAPSLIGTSRR